MKKALDVALRAVVAVTTLAEKAASRGRRLSLRIATLRNALDHEPEWRVKWENAPAAWGAPPDCAHHVLVNGVCRDCLRSFGLGWDARKGTAS